MSNDSGYQSLTPRPEDSHASAPKNIVICCDGTGNLFSAPNPQGPDDLKNGRNSNVVKLYTTLAVGNDQLAYYHPGVGTMGAPTATHWLTREWTRIKGLAFGAGFRDNVLDAYRFLMENYSDNGGNGNEDRVFLFGFSRGSYTARALAGLLHGYGLLCRGNEGHLPYAWRMYAAQHEDRTRNNVQPDESFRLTFSHKTFKIHFVGVFDTVSSVGWISTPLKLFNVASNHSIVHARHAVSIDEHRCFFMDNLYKEPDPPADMVQAWFAGVHSDVGGSYTQPESGLASYSLRWMLEEAKAKGLETIPHREDLVFGTAPTPDPLLYRRPTSWQLHRSLAWAWWIAEIVPHIYYNKEDAREYVRVPLGLRLRTLPPGTLVHESVWQRMTNPPPGAQPYHPRNCPQQFLIKGTATNTAADGTVYWTFTPPLKTRRPILLWLDRFILPPLFAAADLLVLLPMLLFVLALVLAAISLIVAKIVLLLMSRAALWRIAAKCWLAAVRWLVSRLQF